MIVSLISIVILVSACERKFSTDSLSGENPVVINRDATSMEKALVQADNRFGFDLFSELARESVDSNLVLSPYSVAMALGMTLNGAAGQTEAAMRQTLALTGMTQEDINAGYQSLMELLMGQDADVILEIANSIWYKLGYPVQPTFLEINQTYFDAVVRELDFSLPNAVDIINGWIADKTHGKIENALDFIPPMTVMYLINAIYFKGAWAYQFDPENTFNTPFQTPAGPKPCQMMNQHATFLYFHTEDFQAIDLPYGNGKYSMSLILPGAEKSVDDIVPLFTKENWQNWITRFDSTELDLGLPRFKIEYGTLLNDALMGLGMGVAFGGGADFSRIYPDGDIYISRVIHKTFIEVNEEGTEAAAVTIVELRELSAGLSMVVNRPFIFVIHDHNTGAILFMGKVVDVS